MPLMPPPPTTPTFAPTANLAAGPTPHQLHEEPLPSQGSLLFSSNLISFYCSYPESSSTYQVCALCQAYTLCQVCILGQAHTGLKEGSASPSSASISTGNSQSQPQLIQAFLLVLLHSLQLHSWSPSALAPSHPASRWLEILNNPLLDDKGSNRDDLAHYPKEANYSNGKDKENDLCHNSSKDRYISQPIIYHT